MRLMAFSSLLLPLFASGCGKDPERLGAMAGKVATRVGSATSALKTRLANQTLLIPGFVEGLDLSQKVRMRILLDGRLSGCDVRARVLEGDVVELTGSLPLENLRPLVLQSVEAVPGVKGVADAMKTTPPTP